MLPELNLPISVAGRDGFYWWIGQVQNYNDPKAKSIKNRYKVRIIGQHVKSCSAITTADLPWAVVMMPVTDTIPAGNNNFTSVKIQGGDWVIGFFMDGARGQQPVIMGQLPATTNANANTGPTTNTENSCIPYERVVNVQNPYRQIPNNATSSGTPATNPNSSNTDKSPVGSPLNGAGNNENSNNNMAGRYGCANVASKPCETDNGTVQSRFQQVLSEAMRDIQQSGGNLGSSILSPYSGVLLDYAAAAQGYVSRCFGVAKAWITSLKGDLLSWVKKGISTLIQSIMGVSVDPATGKKTKVGLFGQIVQFLNEQLGLINCVIADLELAILNLLTELIYNFILGIINATTCAIESLINEVLSEIESLLTGVINLILGPLQAILDIIASPLNLLGIALSYIFNLIGLKCTGPKNCTPPEETQFCKNSKKKPGQDDFAALDNLINQLSADDGGVTLQSGCVGTSSLPCPEETTAVVTGGQVNPNNYTGTTTTTDIPTEPPFMGSILSSIVTSTPTGNTTESGGIATFNARLSYAPTLNVTVALSVAGETEGTVSPASLTFTPSNWYIDQVITATGVDDTLDDGNQLYRVLLVASSSDTNYSSVSTEVELINEDNETPVAVVFPVDETLIGDSSIKIAGFSNSQIEIQTIDTYNFSGDGSFSISNNTALGGYEINLSPVALPTSISYTLTSDRTSVTPGQSLTFTLRAANGTVANGTVFDYTMFGLVLPSDFSDGTIVGTMTMTNNVATKTITISDTISVSTVADVLFSVNYRTVTFSIINPSPVITTPTNTIPAFKKPVLGKPEVDNSGQIIDIPILDTGDPYSYPPNIEVYGEGVGAFASAILDNNGFIKKIKVERPGRGYTPSRKNTSCYIDGFNLIKPGIGYTEEPKIYIDGDANLVRAKIDNGFVIGLEVIDKTKVFNSFPKVRVVGNGAGAIIMPTFNCTDTPTYNKYVQEVAPSGTDSVIDCP
jgi:hypothetical protein